MSTTEPQPAAIEAFDSIKHTSQITLRKLASLAEQAAKLHPGVIDPQQRQFFRDLISTLDETSKILGQHNFLAGWGSEQFFALVLPSPGIPIPNAEEIVLGLCMVDASVPTDAVFMLKPEFFNVFAHQVIFSHIAELHRAGKEPELHILAEKLRASGQLESIGGLEFLTTLVESVPQCINSDSAIESVIAQRK